ncbi:unnamed protein product [Gulo gulo]|uniref:Uncharacterized protein n=1 Tax=Gulo gulo TaxID=48420 RepID=A0A9X9LR71_GULGU|nr:unnamed protein product [Gulo gulo]
MTLAHSHTTSLVTASLFCPELIRNTTLGGPDASLPHFLIRLEIVSNIFITLYKHRWVMSRTSSGFAIISQSRTSPEQP